MSNYPIEPFRGFGGIVPQRQVGRAMRRADMMFALTEIEIERTERATERKIEALTDVGEYTMARAGRMIDVARAVQGDDPVKQMMNGEVIDDTMRNVSRLIDKFGREL